MLGLVALRLEIEVVLKCVVAALAYSRQDNAHVEFTPSLLLDAERRLLEHCACVSPPALSPVLKRAVLTLLVLLE